MTNLGRKEGARWSKAHLMPFTDNQSYPTFGLKWLLELGAMHTELNPSCLCYKQTWSCANELIVQSFPFPFFVNIVLLFSFLKICSLTNSRTHHVLYLVHGWCVTLILVLPVHWTLTKIWSIFFYLFVG